MSMARESTWCSAGDNSRLVRIRTRVTRMAMRRVRTISAHPSSVSGSPWAFSEGRVPGSKGLSRVPMLGPTWITDPPRARTTRVHSPFLSEATESLRPAWTRRTAKDLASEDFPVPIWPNRIMLIPEMTPRSYNRQGSKQNAPPPLRSRPMYSPSAPSEVPATYGYAVAPVWAVVGTPRVCRIPVPCRDFGRR
ncbi:hypothetical protein ACFFX0_29110 [Citricoccus parietis]|uniref:Uncharacterized protein n=1 Tax=Citricoccus parietis TaxID=592307 RepID=A0ABV5G7V9_9MICC